MRRSICFGALLSAIAISSCFGQEKLEIEGAIIVKDAGDNPPALGTIRFNPNTNDFEGWNGFFWASLTGHQLEVGQVKDAERHKYKTIKIGTQEWMAENLRTSKYHDISQTSIPLIGNDISGNKAWTTADFGAYCVFDTAGTGYTSFDVNKFGYLYNWFAVADSKGLCPSGWHVPSESDWLTLINFLGGDGVAGGKMKETDFFNWLAPNTGASNVSGFSALPGGHRGFAGIGINAFFWASAAVSGSTSAPFVVLFNTNTGINQASTEKTTGFSVRCIKN